MAVTVKAIRLWRMELENKPGALANMLEPLARAGADLHVVMAYRYHGHESKAAIEIFPVSGKKARAAAQAAGLHETSIPVLLVEGHNKPGLGYAMTKAIADAGINMAFLVTQVIGEKYSAVCGFEKEEDSRKASALIKKATAGRG